MGDDGKNLRGARRLNPEKLFVEFRAGVTSTDPVLERHYTLTHSDETADLFLTVALEYAGDQINPMRDEVLAEWRNDDGRYYLYTYIYVDGGEFGPEVTAIRNQIFRHELPLALEAIRYGDREFFHAHPALDKAPILICFDSTYPQYSALENWGSPKDYTLVKG